MNGTLIFMYQPPNSDGWFLRVQNPVSKDFIIPHGILVLAAGIIGVALDGVDNAVLAFFHNADVIGFAVLRTGCAVRVVPVEEKTIMPGEGLTELSAHCPWLRNHSTPPTHPANFGAVPVSR